jgi:hypothetical protein
LDIKESNAGEIYNEMGPGGDERKSKGLKYLKEGLRKEREEQRIKGEEYVFEDEEEGDQDFDDEEEGPPGYKILVIRNKKNANTKNFEFEVVDGQGQTHRIFRNLTDMNWLRNNLRKDFPYSYVRVKVF